MGKMLLCLNRCCCIFIKNVGFGIFKYVILMYVLRELKKKPMTIAHNQGMGKATTELELQRARFFRDSFS